MNFRAVEAKIRKSTFVESIPLLATSFVLIFFVCLLVCTVAADKVAESMAMGLMYSVKSWVVVYLFSNLGLVSWRWFRGHLGDKG